MTDTAPDQTTGTSRGDGKGDGDREAAVFARIEAFRRRRPRLRDEVVTLAHGAGRAARRGVPPRLRPGT
jgi:hypothetical protein